MASEVFHLNLRREQVAGIEYAFLPGDPDRVAKIARHLEAVNDLGSKREFRAMSGLYHGHKVLVCSTGIGGPSTAICVEELAMLGLKQFIRIGTTGAIQAHINPGDLILPSGAVRLDGTSQHLAPLAFPAVANFPLLQRLQQGIAGKGYAHHIGICASSDTFYQGQNRQDSFRQGYAHRGIAGQLAEMEALSVLSFEMEVATLYTQCASYGLAAAAVLGVLVNRHHAEFPDAQLHQATELKVIQAALAFLESKHG